MARIDARLTREIRESGAAGGILFAWIDEWFKKTWVVTDLEIPGENTRQWHNLMDAEQNYGVVGMYAGKAEETPRLGGNTGPWLKGEQLFEIIPRAAAAPGTLRVRSDESHVYLAALFPALAGGPFPWELAGIIPDCATPFQTFPNEDAGANEIPRVDGGVTHHLQRE